MHACASVRLVFDGTHGSVCLVCLSVRLPDCAMMECCTLDASFVHYLSVYHRCRSNSLGSVRKMKTIKKKTKSIRRQTRMQLYGKCRFGETEKKTTHVRLCDTCLQATNSDTHASARAKRRTFTARSRTRRSQTIAARANTIER